MAVAHPAEDKMKRYERVAELIREQIEHGALLPGQRIPSVRELSRVESVSVTTVLEAYRRLEDTGWIEARPQSGFYVRSLPHAQCAEPARSSPDDGVHAVSKSDVISQFLQEAVEPGMIPLGAAVADPSLLPVAPLARLQARLARTCPDSQTYDFSPGYAQLRQQIARRLAGAGCTVSPDDMVITSGCTEAVQISLAAVTRPGDLIAIESPTFFGFLEQIEHLALRTIEVPTDPQEGMCPEALRELSARHKIQAVVLCSNFSNPLGALVPDENKRALARLAAEREMAIIEDDIYGELGFGVSRPKCIKSFDGGDWVIHCGSYSKTLAPGLRVGWAASGRFREALLKLKRCYSSSNAKLPLMTIAEFLSGGGYDHHLRRMRRRLQDNLVRVSQAIYDSFPEGTRVTRPRGGYVLWVEFPDGVDTMQLRAKAAPHRISVVPGILFSPTDRYRHCMRLNAGVEWTPKVEAALRMLGAWAQEQLMAE